MKKMSNIVKICILLIITILCCNFNSVYAAGADDIISGGKNFISAGNSNVTINQSDLKTASDTVFNILSTVGVIIAVIVGLILGIKFMVSSVEEKAQIKQYLMVYIAGCVVIFGAFGIWKLVVGIASTF